MVSPSLGSRLVNAIARQDEPALTACFAPGAELRALVPRGLRERTGAGEAAALITSWFADSTELELVFSVEDEVGDRLHLGYRFEGVEQGQRYVVEQHLACTVADGTIERVDLLCSGFRPVA